MHFSPGLLPRRARTGGFEAMLTLTVRTNVSSKEFEARIGEIWDIATLRSRDGSLLRFGAAVCRSGWET